MSKMIHISINNIEMDVAEGTTILEAARSAEIHIPTLCYLEEINEIEAADSVW
jgi:NADH-quinone oxidoreductase subunit G